MPDENREPLPARKEVREYITLNDSPSFAATTDFPIASFHTEHKDVPEVRQIYLDSGHSVEVTFKIDQSHLTYNEPMADQTIHHTLRAEADMLEKLKLSTRSFRAQSGVFAYIDDNTKLTSEQVSALNRGESIEIKGKVTNYGPNRQELKSGDTMARFFLVNPKNNLSGTKLEDGLKQGWLKGNPDSYHIIDKNRVAVKVNPKRVYVPSDETGYHRWDTRKQLGDFTGFVEPHTSQLIEAGLANKKHPFHLLVTEPTFNLPNDIMAVLDEETSLKDAVHLPSHLIDPGSSWPVRLEILGGDPEWVYFNFYQTSHAPDVAQKVDSYSYVIESKT